MKESRVVIVLGIMKKFVLFSGVLLLTVNSMYTINGMDLIQTEFSSEQQNKLKEWRDSVKLNDTLGKISQVCQSSNVVESIQEELPLVINIRQKSLEDCKKRELYDVDVREQIAYDGRICFALFADKCKKNLSILKELKANDLIEELRRNFLLSQ